MPETLLDVERIRACYGDLRVLWDVSPEIKEGEVVPLIGPNGAGKTITLRAISGLVRLESGQIRFAGEKLNGLTPDDIARRGIAHVPEGRRVFPQMTVQENLELGVSPKFYYVLIGPMYHKEFVEGLGDLSEGVFENGFWHPDLPYPGAKEMARRFEERYKKPPSTDVAYGYTSAQLLQQAIERAGSLDREKVA